MSYSDWVKGNWKLTSTRPEPGATKFDLPESGTLRFDGDGTPGSDSNVYLKESNTLWGKSCVFSSNSVVETVTGIHCATLQPFTIKRRVGEKAQSGEIHDHPHRPLRHQDPDDGGHGVGSGCGVWTANDG